MSVMSNGKKPELTFKQQVFKNKQIPISRKSVSKLDVVEKNDKKNPLRKFLSMRYPTGQEPSDEDDESNESNDQKAKSG